jgi:hypothetical protein
LIEHLNSISSRMHSILMKRICNSNSSRHPLIRVHRLLEAILCSSYDRKLAAVVCHDPLRQAPSNRSHLTLIYSTANSWKVVRKDHRQRTLISILLIIITIGTPILDARLNRQQLFFKKGRQCLYL